MGNRKKQKDAKKKKQKEMKKQELSDNFKAFQIKYTLLGKAEWWWLFDDSLEHIARKLVQDNFVVLDHFMGADKASALHKELERAYNAGRLPETKFEMEGCPRLEPGALAGGKTGSGLTYRMNAVRGDYVAWFSGKEPACQWKMLPTYLQRLDTLVAELSPLIPELKETASFRSNAMTTCYPGNGAHYVRHCDNTSQVRNGRKLTALCYCNPSWKPGLGGELRVFGPQPPEVEEAKREYVHVADIEPILDRVVLFFSDERVPHEVLPCKEKRFAVTVWFFDKTEKDAAAERKTDQSLLKEEEERIKREIAKFQAQYGETAQIVHASTEEPIDSDDEVEQAVSVQDAVETTQIVEDTKRNEIDNPACSSLTSKVAEGEDEAVKGHNDGGLWNLE